MVTGEIETHFADAVVLATGGYGNVFYLSTNAMGCNVTATWRRTGKGRYFANPCYTQIHPTCIRLSGDYQSKLTLDERVAAQRRRIWVPKSGERQAARAEIPEEDRDYYLERIYPAFGNLVPADIASRAAKNVCDEGRGGRDRGARRLPGLRRRDQPARAQGGRGQVRQPVRHVRPDHRREPVRDADADLPGRCTTRWAASGSTTTCSPRSRACT
jgi:succinate dehydrogenase/fumarate reductase flavoprotein subunit